MGAADRLKERSGWRTLVASCLAALLCSPSMPLSAQQPEQQAAIDSADVAPLTSPEPREDGSSVPAGRFGPSDSASVRPERVRELPEQRTATTDTWENADGSRSVTVSSTSRYYQPVGSLEWLPIDTAIVRDSDRRGWLRSSANRWTAYFGPSDAAEGMLQVETDGTTVGFVPVGATEGAVPASRGSSASYAELWSDTDVIYTVTPVGTDERIVLHSPSAPTSFGFDVIGAEPRPRGDGGIDLVAGELTIGSIPAPTVETAEGPVRSADPGAVFTVTSNEADGAGSSRVTVSISKDWLGALPDEAFPVVIDPTFVPSSPSTPTAVKSLPATGSTLNDYAQAGTDGSDRKWRAAAYVPIPAPPTGGSQPWYLIDATMMVDRLPGSTGTCVCTLAAYGQPFGAGTFGDVGGAFSTPLQPLETGTSDFAFDVSSWVAEHPGAGLWYGFRGDEDPSHDQLHLMATPTSNGITVEYRFFQSSDPTHLVSPSGTISSTSPTLTAEVVEPSDPDPLFDTVYYRFKLATDPDGSGTVIDSGWVDTPTWTVPPGVLVDGATYYVRVWNNIGTPWAPGAYGYFPPAEPIIATPLTIEARLGEGGPTPTDTVGATPGSTQTPSAGAPSPGIPPANVTVNMVTGNLAAVVGTRSLSALGGSAGVSLNYDSLGPETLTGSGAGLYGSYLVDGQPIGQRLDPSIDFSWAGSPMGGAAGPSSLEVVWNGVIRMPASGTWKLGGSIAPGGTLRIYLDGSSSAYTTVSGGSVPTFGAGTLAANSQHAIRVVYQAPSGVARLGQLWAYNTDLPVEDPQQKFVVPGDWLAPRATGLPVGWRLSANPHAGGWTRVEDLGSQVIVHSATGASAAFTRLADGTYLPPPGSDALLTTRRNSPSSGLPSGSDLNYELTTANSLSFVFGRDGWVQSVRSLADDLQPTALEYGYTTLSGTIGAPVLTEITDPVTDRSIELCYGPSCAGGDSTWHVPDGMLGRIDHWDGTTTELRYDDANTQLARIVAPGALVADFAYDTDRRLVSLRDPLATAATAAGQRADCDLDPAQCSYTFAYDSEGRVATVLQPAATQEVERPRRDYDWTDVQDRRSTVEIPDYATIPIAVLTATTVWDEQGRVVEQHDPAGRITRTRWDPDIDRPVATIDPAGLQATSVYDEATNYLTDEYGPAPAHCFAATFPFAPNGTCADVPHAQHFQDEAIDGLRATFWANPYFAGAPASHGTGFGGTQGGPSDPLQCPTGARVLTCAVWPTLPVTPTGDSIPVTGNAFTWSARFEGSITSPTDFVLNLETAQHATVYINGLPYDEIDARTANGPYTHSYGTWPAAWADPDLAVVPAGTHRIRIDYLGSSTSDNGLWIDWSPNLLAARDCVVDTNGMLAWWTGDDTLAAEIGADATGVVGFAAGTAGTGMQFNSNLVTVPDFPVITNSLTVEAWVKPQNSQWDIGTIMSRYLWGASSPNNAYWLQLYNGANWVLDDTSTIGAKYTSSPGSLLYDGNFHHLAATFDVYSTKVYIDGQLAASSTYYPSSGVLNAATGVDFRIGSYGVGAWFAGMIDEPAVFNRPLTASEIDAIYDAGSAGKCDDPPTATASLSPMYGLQTRTIDPDGKTVTTSYSDPANGIGPHHRLPTAVTQDPDSLALTTNTTYENPGDGGWLRKTTSTLPGGGTTTWTHYCGDQASCGTHEITGAIATACGVTAGAPQWGLPAQQTDPAPEPGVAGRAQQFLYDTAGRTVGRRVGPSDDLVSAPWQCTTYDTTGRVLAKTWPTPSGATARSTATYTYAVAGNPLRASVSDVNGTITATVDLLGRTTTYTDTTGRTTNTIYDQPGRVTLIDGPQIDLTNTYNATTGELETTTATLNGTPVVDATVGHDPTTGRMTSVSYQGGLINLSVDYDADTSRRSSLTYSSPSGRLAGHSADYSPAGRMTNIGVDTGGPALVDPNPTGDDYLYDGAGRLSTAWMTDGRFDYGYAELTGGQCSAVAGNNPAAGRNTNRSTLTWTPTSGPAATTTSCFDGADQLLEATEPGGPSSFDYDDRGNTTSAGDDTYTWDASDRLAGIASPSTDVIYTHDALDRPIARTEDGVTTRYGYSGHTDAATTVLDGVGAPVQHLIGLPGGVMLTVDGTERTYSLPDLHGHTIATADKTGNRIGPLHTYDPWGNEHPTATPGVDNLDGNADQGAYATAGKLTEHGTTIPIVLMGARAMSPTHGRFLSIDPVKGGCANDYVYVHGDPINTSDLAGRASNCRGFVDITPIGTFNGWTDGSGVYHWGFSSGPRKAFNSPEYLDGLFDGHAHGNAYGFDYTVRVNGVNVAGVINAPVDVPYGREALIGGSITFGPGNLFQTPVTRIDVGIVLYVATQTGSFTSMTATFSCTY